MDLTLQVTNSTKLNIRVAIILETPNGFVFSQNKKDKYLYPIGGRAKIGENSVQSAVRELKEETGLDIAEADLKLISIIENFWETEKGSDKNKNNKQGEEKDSWKIQEINFVFSVPKQTGLGVGTDIDSINLHEIKKENLQDLDIRPAVFKEIILRNQLQNFSHFIV